MEIAVNKALKKKLDIVFANSDEKRYIPRAIPNRAPGSFGWLTFDQQAQRFLTGEQVMAIDDDTLRNETERPQ